MSQDVDDRVATLLRRGTDQLPHVDLARAALRRARVVRRRRRSGAAVVVAAAVAAGAVLVPTLGGGRDQQAAVPRTTASASPSTDARAAFDVPSLPRSVVTGSLDPADVGLLPAADLSVPRDLTPSDAVATPPDQAVMVTKSRLGDQSLLYALDRDGSWHRVRVDAPADLPARTGPSVTSGALSPDGRTAVLLGRSAAYVVDLGAGTTRRFPLAVPLAVAWQDDSRHVRITAASGRSALLDVRSWAATWSTFPAVAGLPLVASYDGTTLVHRQVLPDGGAAYVEQRGGRDVLVAGFPAGRAYDATQLVASSGRLVLAASPSVGPRDHERGTGPGLLVLDRPSYGGRAFLDVGDGSGDDSGYLVGDALVPRGWVTDDLLLFSLAPQTVTATTVEHPRQVYLTWDLRSGEVRRVGETSAPWRDSSWATALLH